MAREGNCNCSSHQQPNCAHYRMGNCERKPSPFDMEFKSNVDLSEATRSVQSLYDMAKENDEIGKRISEFKAIVSDFLRDIKKGCLGREVRLNQVGGSKHAGRLGQIDSIMIDGGGEVLFLVYIYRLGTRERLNGEPWTRTYRPWSHFTLED